MAGTCIVGLNGEEWEEEPEDLNSLGELQISNDNYFHDIREKEDIVSWFICVSNDT